MTEPDMKDVFRLYQRKMGVLSSAQKEKLYFARDEGMSPFVIGCAILRAKQEQRKSREQGQDKHISFNYIYRIIEDWLGHNITTEESFSDYWADQERNRRRERSVYGKTQFRREDFSYSKPSKQDKDFFPFLDE
ncbi:MAG: DnaD domain protein [Firmicutes bacterium]|nr:DnaD domain protein [Bacillota bacterium]